VVQVLAERGLRTDGERPELLTDDGVREADLVITMGCGETCPVIPGKTYQDWQLDDPQGKDIDSVRRIVDEIDAHVRTLLAGLGLACSPLG
jgi:arsenate reductase